VNCSTAIVYRGDEIPLAAVHRAAIEVLGGHLRPDAQLAVHACAPVRVDRRGRGRGDPLAGTVRALHLAVDRDTPSILTDLSRMVLPGRLGFPPGTTEQAWEHFGHAPAEAVALMLSEPRRAPIAALSLDEDEHIGSYSILSAGQRLWSASYRPGESYATWDGQELRVEPMELGDPEPVEGAPSDFPVHGLNLLFDEPLELTIGEQVGLMAALWRAARPPTESARGIWLVRDGRFVQDRQPLGPEDWQRLTGSFCV